MHVLTPVVFDLLDELVRENVRELGQIQLTTALNALAQQERYLALETRGSRFNLGVKFGVVEAQIALALGGVDREQILALLLESIVRIEQNVAALTQLAPDVQVCILRRNALILIHVCKSASS